MVFVLDSAYLAWMRAEYARATAKSKPKGPSSPPAPSGKPRRRKRGKG